MDFIYPDTKRFSNKELHEMVLLLGSQYVKGSREGQVRTLTMEIQQGKGAMAIFTNSLKNTEFTYTSKGVIFKGNWLIHFTLLSNNLNSDSYQFVLNSLNNELVILKQ